MKYPRVDTVSSTALIVGLVALLAPGAAAAQTNAESVLPLARLAGPLELDGMVDEPAWDAVEPVPMTVFQPTFGGTPTERTEIRIAYDDTYLWVSGRMYDSDPSGVRANTLYRDRYSGDDLLSILIDSFNDYETALWFSITPCRPTHYLPRNRRAIAAVIDAPRPGRGVASWGESIGAGSVSSVASVSVGWAAFASA